MAFPTLVQLPATTIRTFRTSSVDHESGQRYSYYHRATPLLSWDIQLGNITDAELATWKAHWDSMKGPWDTDTFTDPDSGTGYTARYAMDAIEWTNDGPNTNSLHVIIEQVL